MVQSGKRANEVIIEILEEAHKLFNSYESSRYCVCMCGLQLKQHMCY